MNQLLTTLSPLSWRSFHKSCQWRSKQPATNWPDPPTRPSEPKERIPRSPPRIILILLVDADRFVHRVGCSGFAYVQSNHIKDLLQHVDLYGWITILIGTTTNPT